jgi:hypothetical protein
LRSESLTNMRRIVLFAIGLAIAALALRCPSANAAPRADGQLTIEVVDSETGQPIAARMHLKNARGRPLTLRLANTAEFGGHFYIDGKLVLPLRAGQYTFELDAGPEYRTQSGHFETERHADDTERIEMKRVANLAEEGWYGGDLDVLRRVEDVTLIMRAEGLHVAPSGGERPRRKTPTQDEFLLLFEAANGAGNTLERVALDTSLAAIEDARQKNLRVVARTPYAWEVPAWLASGELAAISLIHHHALRDDVVDNEKDGRPRDRSLFPGNTGNGRWSEAIYYHALNCGLRVPPAAGSGSGTNDNPVGTNRVYVHCGEEFSNERWWEGLEAGRVVVTNGPLLRPLVEGHPPGYIFRLEAGESLSLEVAANLATRVPVEYLQIIKNGAVASEVRLADFVNRKGRLPPVSFDESGWFLVRAVTTNQKVYQFASSGPFYVEQAGSPRVSRRSVQFFLDWTSEVETRLGRESRLDEAERERLLAEHQSARRFFEGLLATANAE